MVVGIVSAGMCATKALVSFYGSLLHYWVRRGSYADCPFFSSNLHAKTYVYSIALLNPLWGQSHYRHPSFYKDLVTNLRNVAIPGTGVPLSIVCYSRLLLFPFLVYLLAGDLLLRTAFVPSCCSTRFGLEN